MKKILALLLALVMALSLCACGKNNSGVTIDELEAAIKGFDAEAVVQKTSSNKEYTFSYAKTDDFGTMTIQGKADSNEMLESIVASRNVLNADEFNGLTKEQAIKDYGDMMNVPLSRLLSYELILNFSRIVTLLAPEGADEQFDGTEFLLSAIRTPKTYGNWKYTITTDSNDDTATITAEYIGE